MAILALRFDQETFSDRTKGTHGDCTRAVVRTLAQAAMPELPHPIGANGDWNEAFFDRLNDEGWVYRFQPYRRTRKNWNVYPRFIGVSGPTVRSDANEQPYHLVVYDTQTHTVIHDPHPSRAGLLSLSGMCWLEPTS